MALGFGLWSVYGLAICFFVRLLATGNQAHRYNNCLLLNAHDAHAVKQRACDSVGIGVTRRARLADDIASQQ